MTPSNWRIGGDRNSQNSNIGGNPPVTVVFGHAEDGLSGKSVGLGECAETVIVELARTTLTAHPDATGVLMKDRPNPPRWNTIARPKYLRLSVTVGCHLLGWPTQIRPSGSACRTL